MQLVTAPTFEPLTVEEAKAHLRLEITEDDALVRALIRAARTYAETVTGRQLAQATWLLSLDSFPCSLGLVRFPRPPLVSVSSVVYTDGSGGTQTLATTEYQVDATSEPGRMMPAYGKTWPATRCQMGAISITFVAGYASRDLVPADIKQAMLMLIAHWYENREAAAPGSMGSVPMAVDALFASGSTGTYMAEHV